MKNYIDGQKTMKTPTLKPKRKYGVDISIGFASMGAFHLTASEVHSGKEMTKEEESFIKKCHIYMICRQPYMSIDPISFSVFNGNANGRIIRHVNGKKEYHAFSIPIDPDLSQNMKISAYPHRSIISGDRIWPTTLLGRYLGKSDPSFLQFEVLYIGQAFGKGGSRDALTRLRSHGTLQKILATGAADFPDDEISVVGFCFDHPMIMTIIDQNSPKDGDLMKSYNNTIKNPLKESEQINLIEAGLISYFKPHYNVMFKDNFPHSNHKILQNPYKNDIASISIEIDTEIIFARLWSKEQKDGTHHTALYNLHDSSVRQGFFTITGHSGEIVQTVQSGPSF